MMRVETTPGCPRTPQVLMALEEVGLEYAIELREDGFFAKTYNVAGPRFEDDDVVMFQATAILRYLMRVHAPSSFGPQDAREWAVADQWMDFAIAPLLPAAARLARHRHNVPTARQDRALIEAESHLVLRSLAALDAFLAPRRFILGRFSLVDCVFVSLKVLPLTELPTDHFSAVQDYLARLFARPAYLRADGRMRDAAV